MIYSHSKVACYGLLDCNLYSQYNLIGKCRNSVIEELEIGQPYKLDNGLEITSVKKPRSCFKKVRT